MSYPNPAMPAPPNWPCGPACADEDHERQAADLAVVTPWPFGEWIAVVHECWAAGYPVDTIVDLAVQGVRPGVAYEMVRETTGYQLVELGTAARQLVDSVVAELSWPRKVVWRLMGPAVWVGAKWDDALFAVRRWRDRRKFRRAARAFRRGR